MFDMILEQGLDYVLSDKYTFDDMSRFEQLQKDNRDKIINYFMDIKDKLNFEELGFYQHICISLLTNSTLLYGQKNQIVC